MRVCALILLSLTIHPVFSQLAETDSLKRLLRNAEGTERVDLLNALTYRYLTNDNALAMRYCDEALDLSHKLEYEKGEGVAWSYRGVYEYLSMEFSNGRTNLRRGLRLAQLSNDRINEGYSLFQLGSSYLDQAILDSSLFFFDRAYIVLKDSTAPATLSKLYRNMSILYGLRAEYSRQNAFMERSLAIRRALNNKALIADGLITLVSFRIRKGDYAGAARLLKEAEDVLRTIPEDQDDLNDYRHQKALILMREKKFDDAMVLFDSAKSYYLRASFLLKFVTLQKDLGKVFLDRGDYELALKSLYEGLRVSQIKRYEFETMDIQLLLGWVNFQLGDLRQSLAYADTVYGRLAMKNMPNRTAEALTLKGVVLAEVRDYKTAKACLDQVIKFWEREGDQAKLSEACFNLGFVEESMRNFEKARQLFEKSYALAKISNYDFGLAWASLGMATVKLHEHEYSGVEPLLVQAERYAQGISEHEALARIYVARRDALAAEGRYKEALYYSMKASTLLDSIKRKDLARRFVSLQKVDEIERRDQSIKDLTQERQLAREKIATQELKLKQQYILIIAAGIAIALIAAIAIMFWQFYSRIKRLNQSIRTNHVRIQHQANDLVRANNELGKVYKAVKEQKEEIEAQADKLTKSNSQINQLNKNLEALVAEKTHDLQKTNEELIRHNHDLLQFSYSLSHHLRGPVARLLGLTDLLRYSKSKEELDRMSEMVNKTSKELDLVIGDLSKTIDIRNDLYNRKEVVILIEVWSMSCVLLQPVISPSFEITSDFERAPALVTIRPIIQSIFYNLLSNAIKYRSPDRDLRVVVSSFRKEGKMIVEFQDNGLGIELARFGDSVFKLFKRFHTHVEGRGIGLYLVKSQVEALGGTIYIESEVDQGTKFRIAIPENTIDAIGSSNGVAKNGSI